MGELETEGQYEGKVKFTIVKEDAPDFKAAVAEHELGTHGLVAFDADGNKKASLPGHNFGRAEVEEVIAQVLPE